MRPNPNGMPFLMLALLGLVIVVLIGLATGSWLWFGIALAVHLIASAIVLTGWARTAESGGAADRESEQLEEVGRRAAGTERPDPVTELEALKHGDRQTDPARR
jgi:membrane protein implicated in regulation of membrane protease activity